MAATGVAETDCALSRARWHRTFSNRRPVKHQPIEGSSGFGAAVWTADRYWELGNVVAPLCSTSNRAASYWVRMRDCRSEPPSSHAYKVPCSSSPPSAHAYKVPRSSSPPSTHAYKVPRSSSPPSSHAYKVGTQRYSPPSAHAYKVPGSAIYNLLPPMLPSGTQSYSGLHRVLQDGLANEWGEAHNNTRAGKRRFGSGHQCAAEGLTAAPEACRPCQCPTDG